MGSSPTALHAEHLDGVTEVRAGVYMFGDLFQAEIGTHDLDAIALTVLTSVIGRRPGRLLVDAGGLRCRRTAAPRRRRRIMASAWYSISPGAAAYGDTIVRRAYQEHGVVEPDHVHRARPAGGREAAHCAESHLHDRGGA